MDSNYDVKKRRRRERSTDYQNRLNLVKSGKPRVVVRTTNNNTRVHISQFNREGDENSAQTISKQLADYGWDEHNGNLPAAYLTGYLAGHKADVDEAVLDTGLRTVKPGSRVFAAVKGLNDAGVHVAVGEEMLPEEGRMKGEHIEKMKDSDITDTFETVKQNIEDDN